MKITRITPYLLKRELDSSMCISRGGFDTRYHALVEVQTDAGITGLGEGVGNAPLVHSILQGPWPERALGRNPFDIEGMRKALLGSDVYFERKGSVLAAASAIEMACWDIKGKASKLPVHELLGGRLRDRIEAYASDVYWEEDPHAMADNARRIVDLGYRTIKIHIGCKSPDEEIMRVEAIRQAIGPEVQLMIDLNAGYTGPEARRAARLWEPYDIFWLEEPVHPDQVSVQAELRSRIECPIASGENEFALTGFKEMFDKGAVDFVMPDIARVGGLMETWKICTLAQAYGLAVSPHNFSSGVLLAATLHLMAAVPNTRLLELDTSSNAVYQELLVEPLKIEGGVVGVPEHPGLGVRLTEDILNQYAVQ